MDTALQEGHASMQALDVDVAETRLEAAAIIPPSGAEVDAAIGSSEVTADLGVCRKVPIPTPLPFAH